MLFYTCKFEVSNDTIAQGVIFFSSPTTYASIEIIVDCIVYNARPFVDIFGIIGNILCICLNLSPQLRRAPTTLHLTALASYDLIFLLGEVPYTFKGLGADSLKRTDFGCWASRYIYYVASCLSSWTVTAFAIERYIVVHFPLHRAALCTFKNTIIIHLCLIPIPLLLYCPLFFNYVNEMGFCVTKPLLFKWLRLVDTGVANFIPLIIILTLNGLTAFRMWKYDRKRKENQELRLHSTAAANSSTVSRPLFIVSTTFAILNLPYYAIHIKWIYVNAVGSMKTDWSEFDGVFSLIAKLLWHANFAGDFLLYNFASKTFRTVAMDILIPRSLRHACYNRQSLLRSFLFSRSTSTTNV